MTLYHLWCLHLSTPPTPTLLTPHTSSSISLLPSLHLLLSNCLRNHSFISITCRKHAEPRITPLILLWAFLYRLFILFPGPFPPWVTYFPSLCLFLKCPSLTSSLPQSLFENKKKIQLLDLPAVLNRKRQASPRSWTELFTVPWIRFHTIWPFTHRVT